MSPVVVDNVLRRYHGELSELLRRLGVVDGPSLPVDDRATAARHLRTTRATLTALVTPPIEGNRSDGA